MRGLSQVSAATKMLALAGATVLAIVLVSVMVMAGAEPTACEAGVADRFPELVGTDTYDDYVQFCEDTTSQVG